MCRVVAPVRAKYGDESTFFDLDVRLSDVLTLDNGIKLYCKQRKARIPD